MLFQTLQPYWSKTPRIEVVRPLVSLTTCCVLLELLPGKVPLLLFYRSHWTFLLHTMKPC